MSIRVKPKAGQLKLAVHSEDAVQDCRQRGKPEEVLHLLSVQVVLTVFPECILALHTSLAAPGLPSLIVGIHSEQLRSVLRQSVQQ